MGNLNRICVVFVTIQKLALGVKHNLLKKRKIWSGLKNLNKHDFGGLKVDIYFIHLKKISRNLQFKNDRVVSLQEEKTCYFGSLW